MADTETKEDVKEEQQEEVKAPPSKRELEKQDKRRIKEQEKAYKKQLKEEKKNLKYEKRAKKRERKHQWKTSGARKVLYRLLFLAFLGGLVAVLVFNVLDIRDKYLRQYLEQVPVINELLPPQSQSSIDDLKSKEELQAEIESLKSQIDTLNSTVAERDKEIVTNKDEIERLKVFEDEYLQFLDDKLAFDQIVGSASSEDYIDYYEAMYPENAERIYADLKDINIDLTEFKDYIAVYSSMEPSDAASIMEEMMVTDIQLVVAILDELSTSFAGEILAEMPADKAATIAKLLSPTSALQ